MNTVLVTGAAGFIGYFLSRRLLDDGYRVVGLDNLNDYYDPQLKLDRLAELGVEVDELPSDITDAWSPATSIGPNVRIVAASDSNRIYESAEGHPYADRFRFYAMDLADREAMAGLFEEESFDAVVNLAAQAGVRYSLENPHLYVESNVTGFLNVLEGCRHNSVEHLVYASSSSVYGANREMPFRTSDNVDHPVSLYAATKKSNELMGHTYAHLYGIPTTGLRFFTVYGPWGRPDMAYFKFADLMRNGRSIDVYNFGRMSRDFTYVDDIVESVVRLLPKPPAGSGSSPAADGSGGEAGGSAGGTGGSGDSDSADGAGGSGDSGSADGAGGSGDSGSAGSGASDSGASDSGATDSGAPHQLFNIGNNSPVDLMAFIEEIEKQLGIEAEKNLMEIQPGDVPSTWADVSDLFDYIDYQPKVGLEEGIARFVEWYRSYYGM